MYIGHYSLLSLCICVNEFDSLLPAGGGLDKYSYPYFADKGNMSHTFKWLIK